MNRKKLLLSFDIEEFDLPLEYSAWISESDKDRISAEGTAAILEIMRRTGIRATFFITGFFASRHIDMIKEMVRDGHEIASHGMDHSAFAIAHLRESRELLENISGTAVTGFRMARLAPVAKQDILNAGYDYESSLNPVWLPGRYCNISKPLLPFREKCGLVQLPVSALPVVRFPLFWLAFKNMPLPLYKAVVGMSVAAVKYFNMYSHPWEYSAAAADPVWKIPGYVVKHAGISQCRRLESLIKYLQPRGEFVTFQEYLKDFNG